MAPKNKARAVADENTDPNAEKAKKKGGKAPVIIIILVFVAILGAAVFDIYGPGRSYLRGVLNNVPIVRNILPPEKDADEGENLEGLSQEQLIKMIDELTDTNTGLQNDLDAAKELHSDQMAEIEKLRVFEAQQGKYRKDKEEFDRLVAMGDPAAYSKYYDSISPDNREKLYGEASEEADRMAKERSYVKMISEMDESAAAAALEILIPTDMGLVVRIVTSLDRDKAGAIVSEMEPRNAASVMKMTAPGGEATPVPTAPAPSPEISLTASAAEDADAAGPTMSP